MTSNDGKPSGGMIRGVAAGVKKVLSAPLASFGWGEVRDGRRFIGDLVNSMRAEAPIDRRFQYHKDGRFDLEATASRYGISVWELEKQLAKRRSSSVAVPISGLAWVGAPFLPGSGAPRPCIGRRGIF